MKTTQGTTRTTQEVANRLVELCRKGQIPEAAQELYADTIESIEPANGPMKSASGKTAVLERGKQFAAMVEQRHGGSFSEPVVGGNHFSVAMKLDATFKGRGRSVLDEVCVYEVKDGMVVKEQFFY